MTARFLLDTNIVSDLVRRPQGPVAAAIAGVGESLVCTSMLAAAVLRYGAAKKGSPRLSQQLDAVLGAMAVLALVSPADRFYGDIRADLERCGLLIGPNDLLIAAHALALDCILITDNERKLGRVRGLPLENWLRGRA